MLLAALRKDATDASAYEASVRCDSERRLRAGRMMVERATSGLLEAIAASFQIPLPTVVRAWNAAALGARVPLIVGWDAGDETRRCVKLYVNCSDASQRVRRELCAALLPGLQSGFDPAVFGMNLRENGAVETKLYAQAADAQTLARSLGAAAESLAAAARAEGADAGGVASYDVTGETLAPRAFFLALREPSSGEDWGCVTGMPGFDRARLESLLPFAPAAPRSLGISLVGPAWTLYFKPRGSSRAPHGLEPLAVFRGRDAEVGVFVEPTQSAARAFRRTERHAVSIRVRHGEPDPSTLETLVDWFADKLTIADPGTVELARLLAEPPPPWQLVGDDGKHS